MSKRRISIFITIYFFGLFLMWYGGNDLTERNFWNAYFLFMITFVAGLIAFIPGIDDL
jgi:hypothetical protein